MPHPETITEKERNRLLAGRENVHRKPLCSRNPVWLACQRLFYFGVLLPVYGVFYRFGMSAACAIRAMWWSATMSM